MPLHVFEPRYLSLVQDVLANAGALAIAMLKPGADALASRAPVCKVACAGRIVHREMLADGRCNILVHGIERVALGRELPLERGYRRFEAQLFGKPDARYLRSAQKQIARLQSSVLSLQHCVGDRDADLVEVLRVTSNPIELADILGAILVSAPDERQALLETADVRVRFSRVVDAVAEAMAQAGESSPTVVN